MHLNELSFDNMGDWPWLIKAGFAAFIIAITALIIYLNDTSFLYKKISKEKSKQIQIINDLKKKQTEALSIKDYQYQLQKMKQNNFLLVQQIPKDWNVGQMIQLLSKMAKNCNLIITRIKPQTEITTSSYIALPLHISVQGNYSELGKFIADLTHIKPIITIDSFSLQPMSDNTEFGNIQEKKVRIESATGIAINNQPLQMDFIAHIYRQSRINHTTSSLTSVAILPVKPLPPFPEEPSLSYDYPEDMSPFTIITANGNAASLRQDHAPLLSYSVSALMMTGTLTRDAQTWALVATPDGRVWRVGIGDTLGLEKNRIIDITPKAITLETKSVTRTYNAKPTQVYLRLNQHND